MENHPHEGPAVNRRSMLAMVALGAAATAGATSLAGCSSEAGTGGAGANVDALSDLLPKYQPIDLVKADIPASPPAAPGFVTYPRNLVDAVTEKPGKSGQTVKVTTLNWGPTPPGVGQNAYVDAINSELGVPFDFSVQDGNTYADKLAAILGARDITDVTVVPSWNTNIPRFPDAVKTLFEDLTDYLRGDKALAYPMLASFPSNAWKYSFWNKRLHAVPFVSDGPFAWALFYRKDLLGSTPLPKTAAELLAFGKAVNNPGKNIWAFCDIFPMVQMIFKVPGSEGGWRRNADGTVQNKIELPEFEKAVEFTAKLYAEGLVHPDVASTKGADAKQLFASGKIMVMQDGLGVWQGMYRDQLKVTPGFNMQPMPLFAHDGSTPIMHGTDQPIFYTFIKKGLGAERTEEILRALNWAAAPFGTKEYELRQYGVEGKHFTRSSDGTPVTNDLYVKEYANQFSFMSGRNPAIVGGPDTPNYVEDRTRWDGNAVQYMEPNPWASYKVEQPTNLAKLTTPTLDKITDIIRGRRPLTDLKGIVEEWKANGGNEGRDFYAGLLKS
jgi:putative aldouronate transport system substrate-binding protein